MKRVRSFYICALVLSLLLVAIGNGLSFHSHIHPSDTLVSSAESLPQIVAAQESSHEHLDFDPCEYGFCHLGHCAKLVFSVAFVPTYIVQSQSTYFFKAQALPDLVLEGPYQPPKLS